MKIRNYENKNIIYFILIILIILEIVILIYFYNEKIYKYENIQGTVVKDNLVNLIVTDKQNKIINKNSNLYLNSKIKKYKVIKDDGYILKRNNIKYRSLLIKVKFDKNYKANDSIELIFKSKKIRIIEIFKTIWEGD